MKHYPLSYSVHTVNWDGQLIHKLPEEEYMELFRLLKSLSVDQVMLSGYVTLEKADFDMDEETKRIGGVLDSLGMRPAQHHGLAASYASPADPQEPVVELLFRCIRYTANLNSPVLVIHPGNYYNDQAWSQKVGLTDFFEEQTERYGFDRVLKTAAANLHEAGAYAEKLGVKIALENVDRFEPFGDSETLTELVRLADSPAIGFCLDSGHAHCCGKTSVVEWIDIMGDKLFTTHFHDNRGVRLDALTDKRWIRPTGIDEHRAPGFGTIPWLDVIAKLRGIGYENTVNFESNGWPYMSTEEGYRHAIDFWRTLESISAENHD